MNPLRKFAVFGTVASLALLGACQQAPAPDAAATDQAAPAVSGPDAKPGMSAAGGRLVLPVIGGRPAAIYFSLTNGGPSAVTLAGVHVAGAGKAEMHKTEGGSMAPVQSIEIAPAETIEFAPGGNHVMAFDLTDALKEGGTAELTLTFSDGDKLSMPLRIETMGDGMGHDMGGMQH